MLHYADRCDNFLYGGINGVRVADPKLRKVRGRTPYVFLLLHAQVDLDKVGYNIHACSHNDRIERRQNV